MRETKSKMSAGEKREILTFRYLRDRNLKICQNNIDNIKGTIMEAELRIIFRKHNCLKKEKL
jgi:hypothetical protein